MSKIDDLKLEVGRELSTLQEAWTESHCSWKDAVAQDFETRFITEWHRATSDYLQSLEVLSDEMRKATQAL